VGADCSRADSLNNDNANQVVCPNILSKFVTCTDVSNVFNANNFTDDVLSSSKDGTYTTECQSFTHRTVTFPDLHKYRSTHAKQLVMGHLNINSIRNKFHEIYDILSHELIDVFGLSETKLDQSFTSSQFRIPDYSLYRSDRTSHGGGIMVYVKSSIPHRVRNDLKCDIVSGIESLVIEIKLKSEKMLIMIMYKPPNISIVSLIECLGSVLDRCYAECKSVYLLGDINVNFKNLPDTIEHFMKGYNLKNVIEGPTCFKNAQNPTLIDVILTNTPLRISSHFNCSIGVSDFHNLICVATKMHAPIVGKRKIMYRSFKHFDDTKFNDDLQLIPFSVCDIFDDAEDAFWSYQYLLNEVIDVHAPKKTRYLKKPQLPYMNGQLRKAINVKGMLKRKFHSFKDQSSWNKYKSQRNLVTSLKRKSLKEYFNQRCNNDPNAKKFWDTVRPFMSNSQTGGANISLLDQGRLVTKPSEVCSIFNDHFIHVANDLSEPFDIIGKPIRNVIDFYKYHPSILNINAQASDDSNDFNFTKVSASQVQQSMKKLKLGKACGYDNISAKVLKIGAPVLCESFSKIINRCIDETCFPDCLKNAEVSAIYKKNDSLCKENYRPVSVLTALSKIFENILCDQLTLFFDNVLSELVAAYRSMYSTNNVLIKCVEEWKCALDNKMNVGCVAMDLSKAFDSIPHHLLIAKLKAYGISIDACNTIYSYLTSRKQRVKVNGTCSEWMCTKRGVPQGSILGPLLFNIYINDLIWLLQIWCHIFNYADDNTLSFSHSDPFVVKTNLERACAVAIEWFKSNYMKANADKFQFMMFQQNSDILSLSPNGNEIIASKEIKLLGLTIDKNLNFDVHINKVCLQSSRQINAMSRLSHMLSLPCKLRILDAFIMSNFNYCCIIYHNCKITDARKLEKLLKRALRFVFLDFTSSYKELLLKAERPSLYVHRLRITLMTVYKILHDICPPVCKDFFEKQDVHYGLRRNNLLVQPLVGTSRHGINSLRYFGAVMWNKIPDSVKRQDLKAFKSYVSQWTPQCSCGTCLLCTM